ncbi:hypothetical protein DL96DRAFT_108020 [Flagelloscypha sp. PMI_526]|nr:hypothetical protein DL96DRAFT_108020 [Flagelloscypha sp. PMI_526]
MAPIEIPDGFELILANVVFSCIVLQAQAFLSMGYRKPAGIKYPQLYASKEEEEKSPAAFKFNCAQRVHQNSLETFPQATMLIFIAATNYPRIAAVLGFVWNLGRIGYTYGYLKSPQKRGTYGGFLSSWSLKGLFLITTYMAFGWVKTEMSLWDL